MEEEEEEEITISLIVFEQRLRPRSGQLNLFNELGAKLIKFALLATRCMLIVLIATVEQDQTIHSN